MLIDGKECCTNCGAETPRDQLDHEDTCSMCRTKERGHDEGYREALRSMFDNVADLIDEDGGLDVVDLVADRVQSRKREAERRGEDIVDVLFGGGPQLPEGRRVSLAEAVALEDVAEVMRSSARRVAGVGSSTVANDLEMWATRLAAAAGQRRADRGEESC